MKKQFRFRLGQECRATLPDEDGLRWSRSKRSSILHKFFSDWDTRDRDNRRDKKSWKYKRDTQYHVGKRPQKCCVILPGDQVRTWLLRRYFEKYDISYKIIPQREKRNSVYWIKEERVAWYNMPYYHYGYDAEGNYVRMHQIGYRTECRWVPLVKPIRKERTYYVTLTYRVTWWSKHDIDIEKILAAP